MWCLFKMPGTNNFSLLMSSSYLCAFHELLCLCLTKVSFHRRPKKRAWQYYKSAKVYFTTFFQILFINFPHMLSVNRRIRSPFSNSLRRIYFLISYIYTYTYTCAYMFHSKRSFWHLAYTNFINSLFWPLNVFTMNEI